MKTSHSSYSNTFVGACADTQKAWTQSNLLAKVNKKVCMQVKDTLANGSSEAIVNMIMDIMGPVAPVELRNAMGPATMSHQELAKIILGFVVRAAVANRVPGEPLDVEFLKSGLRNWIDDSCFGIESNHPGYNEDRKAKRIAELIETDAPFVLGIKNSEYGSKMRLCVVAPLAAPIQSLIIVSRVNADLLGNFEAEQKLSKRRQAKVDAALSEMA